MFPLPGVTEGNCGLLLALPGSTVLICGDAIATSEHLERGKVLPNCHNIQQAQASFTEAIEIADVFILGGSYHSVHDGLPWQDAVYDWLARMRHTGRPLLGICGGHQMMAMALGGSVGMVDGGPLCASLPVTLSAAGQGLFHGFGTEPRFHFANEEHVTAAPQGARVLATRPEIPYCTLVYGGNWVSVQFHPEASARCIALAWKGTPHDRPENYVALPEAPGLLVNFIRG